MPRQKPKPIGEMSQDKIKAFWERVQINGPDDCWPWLCARDELGYGFFHTKTIHSRKEKPYPRRTHRIAFRLYYERESDKLICHKCDNPPCCNPTHLFEGTDLDNTEDRRSKGRTNHIKDLYKLPSHETPSSIKRQNARLTIEQVDEIRSLHSMGNTTHRQLANLFNVQWKKPQWAL